MTCDNSAPEGGGPATSVARERRSASAAAVGWLRSLTLAIVSGYILFFVVFWFRTGPGDSDQFLVFHSLQYWNAGLFGLSKQWTPLLCSGLSMAAEPQIPFMSLAMALSYLLGPLAGVKLALLIYLAVGFIGAYLYAGLWLRAGRQRSLAAALFIGNGFFFCRLGLGHFDFAPFLTLPLLLWVLHQAVSWRRELPVRQRPLRYFLAILLTGALAALAIDGSPVTLIHLMLWVGLYAVVLSISERNISAVALFACVLVVASLLDSGYLWPMLNAQSAFPRRTADSFTSALSLLWFAILPLRGKVLPANGNGHELSVFIGPLIMWCIWRNREWLRLPATLRTPLLVVSLVSIVLGMGSLTGLHIPAWLSLFDSLRPLPGFRSINVTGRYWGFLALPLSLLGAAALWRTAEQATQGWRTHVWFGVLLLLQVGFQCETLAANWIGSPTYREIDTEPYFANGPEAVDYVSIAETRQQGEVLSPTRGVCDCYDMDDFVRAERQPGRSLVLRVLHNDSPGTGGPGPGAGIESGSVQAAFDSWNRILLHVECVPTDQPACGVDSNGRVRIVLAQAYHSNWEAAGCRTQATGQGNLLLDCPAARLSDSSVELVFHDELSERSARASVLMWKAWMLLVTASLLGPAFGLQTRWPLRCAGT